MVANEYAPRMEFHETRVGSHILRSSPKHLSSPKTSFCAPHRTEPPTTPPPDTFRPEPAVHIGRATSADGNSSSGRAEGEETRCTALDRSEAGFVRCRRRASARRDVPQLVARTSDEVSRSVNDGFHPSRPGGCHAPKAIPGRSALRVDPPHVYEEGSAGRWKRQVGGGHGPVARPGRSKG